MSILPLSYSLSVMSSPFCPSYKGLLFCSIISAVPLLLLHLDSFIKPDLECIINLAGFLSLLMHPPNTVSVLLLKTQTIMVLYHCPRLKSLSGSTTSGASWGHVSYTQPLEEPPCLLLLLFVTLQRSPGWYKLPILLPLLPRWWESQARATPLAPV